MLIYFTCSVYRFVLIWLLWTGFLGTFVALGRTSFFSWKWVCDVIIIRGPVDFSKRSQMFPAVVSIDAHPSWSLVLFLTQQFTWLFLALQSGAFPILFSSSGSKLYGWPPLSDMSVLLFKGSLLKHFVTVRSSQGFFLLPWVHSRSVHSPQWFIQGIREKDTKIWEKV